MIVKLNLKCCHRLENVTVQKNKYFKARIKYILVLVQIQSAIIATSIAPVIFSQLFFGRISIRFHRRPVFNNAGQFFNFIITVKLVIKISRNTWLCFRIITGLPWFYVCSDSFEPMPLVQIKLRLHRIPLDTFCFYARVPNIIQARLVCRILTRKNFNHWNRHVKINQIVTQKRQSNIRKFQDSVITVNYSFIQ